MTSVTAASLSAPEALSPPTSHVSPLQFVGAAVLAVTMLCQQEASAFSVSGRIMVGMLNSQRTYIE